ncbi:uncharacterized protein LOC106666677 [Cimex lectularius]|uniref:DUF4773 domain-containing protein n=1 Tax=Cimex lectularius TaxID=79782 RepID=A0A8I6SRJ0_CIMLE|nr:uncharacterized protein LOC106666677 [Cimex lectularius]
MTNVKAFILTLLVVSVAVTLCSGENADYPENDIFAEGNSTVATILKSWDLAFRLSPSEDYVSWAAWETSKNGFSSLLNKLSDHEISATVDKDLQNLTKWKDALRDSFSPAFHTDDNNHNFSLCITDPLGKKLCTEITTIKDNYTLTVTTKIDDKVQTSQNIEVFNPLAFCLTVPDLTENRYCLMTYNINYTKDDFNGCLRVDYHVWYERFDFPTVCVTKEDGKYNYEKKELPEKAKKSKLFHESPLPTSKRQ